jgi:hypothetical protein
MIPQLVTVRYRRPGGRRLRLYVLVLPVLLVLSPLLLLVVLAGFVACFLFEVSPAAALRGIGKVLRALPGTQIELADGQMAIQVNVR